MKKLKIFILILLTGSIHFSFSQGNNTCANATPFCTGQTMTFPSTTGVPNSQPGPAYGCLGSQPNPAWFFMQISTGGSLSISMGAASDIDFICWGPFPNLNGACGNLTAGNIVDCSYSAAATETCDIANAIPGEFYVMLITNFSNQNQTISFNQGNFGSQGAGGTNCGFVCSITPTNSGMICKGASATISLSPATSSAVTTWTWSGPGNFSSTTAVNTIPNLQTTGTYTVRGTATSTFNGVPTNGTCQAVTTITVVPYPTYTPTASQYTICQGGSFVATILSALQPNLYTAIWATTAPPPPNMSSPIFNLIPTNGTPPVFSTNVMPALLPANVTSAFYTYSVTVSPNVRPACSVTQTIGITINNPATPVIPTVALQCDNFNPVQLTATPGGGTWSAANNTLMTPGGLFSPAAASIGINSVTYSVSVGQCIVSNSQTISVSKYYSPALTSSINLCEQDPAFNLMNIAQNTLTGIWSAVTTPTSIVSNNFLTVSGLNTGTYTLKYKTFSSPVPHACMDSVYLTVPVFNPPTPTIIAIPPLCTNAASVLLTAIPPGGLWSGATGVSPSGVQTPSANLIGTNNVIYTAGQGTCVASSSRTFHVSQYNPPVFTGILPHLCFNSNTVNLMGIVQNTNGAWSCGAMPNIISNNVFNPAVVPLGQNVLSLKYRTFSLPNTTLCPDSNLINISVYKPHTPVITPVPPVCSADNPIQLSVSPALGSWVQTSYLSTGGSFSPALSPLGSNNVQYVIGTNTCFASQSINISTEAFISAALLGNIPDQCSTGLPVSLAPFTANGSGYWTGPGIVGTSFNPAIPGAGKFTLTYNTASFPSGLCPDKALVPVEVFSLAIPSIVKIGPFCNQSEPVKLDVSPVGGLFGGPVPGAVTSGGLFNPALALVGKNVITYSVSSGPCIANAQTIVEVEKFVSAAFEKHAAVAYCVNNLPFNLNGLVQNPGGKWSGGAAVIGEMFDPSKANIGNNNMVVYETHSTSDLLCPDRSTIIINVKSVPVVKAVSNIDKGCAPLEVILTSSDGSAGKGSWFIEDGSEPIAGLTTSHIFTKPGTYPIVFNFEDNEVSSCSTQVVLKNPITVFETPHAGFEVYPDEVTISSPVVELTNTSTTLGNNRYLWTIQGLNQSYEVNPVVDFPQIGNYKVTLVASTADGCRDEISKVIEVKNDFGVYIPNSFTPNYDELNDTFKPVFSPYGLDTKTYSLEIFDRWGKLLFSTGDYMTGWNGTINNKGDEKLKEDVYIFRIEYKDLDGRAYNKTGDVTLLK